MLEFKNPSSNIKRKLKILDIEKNLSGEISKLYVEDTIENNDEQLIRIDEDNLKSIITNMANKEFMLPYAYAQVLLYEMLKQVKTFYTEDSNLPSTDQASCYWELIDDYVGAVKIEGNKLVFNREIYDVEFGLRLELTYEGNTVYGYVKSTLKGRGTAEFTDPNDLIYELVKNVPSYLENDYKLPTVECVTWTLVGENEQDVVLEDNYLNITNLKNDGDGRIELKVECKLNNQTAVQTMYITIDATYFFDSFNYELERTVGEESTLSINLEAKNNKTLYVEARHYTDNFSIIHKNNNSSQIEVLLKDTENLYNAAKCGSEEFVITFNIYSNEEKYTLYGTEYVTVKYIYGLPYYVESTEADLIGIPNQSDKVSFFIKNLIPNTIYPVLTKDNENLNINIYETLDGDINIEVTDKEEIIDTSGSVLEYKFEVTLYSDSAHTNSLGTIEYTVYYTCASTDPID
ncbi:MAG: hypothetical protein IJX78_01195 [Bacilli bacterium]|nr:hypothetical protein [Bacilli bacterium]